jgi:hypothetical protein
MLLPNARSPISPWLVTDARIWVLVVVLVGMLVSSIGLVSSHGLATLASTQHRDDSVHGHGHSHDEEGAGAVADVPLVHAHHNADHSHDNAQVPSLALASVAPAQPDWRIFHPARMKGLVAYRLERPPMA